MMKHYNLTNIGIPLKVLFTSYLCVVGIGYMMAFTQILFTHGMADGKFGLSIDDIEQGAPRLCGLYPTSAPSCFFPYVVFTVESTSIHIDSHIRRDVNALARFQTRPGITWLNVSI